MRRIVMLCAVLALTGPARGSDTTAGPEYLSYEEFLEKVRAEKVTSVTMGTLDYLKGSYSEGDTQKQFVSKRPLESASDPLLTELLAEHKVELTREEPADPGAMDMVAQYGPFMLLLPLPTVLGVIVLVYLVRMNKRIDQVLSR